MLRILFASPHCYIDPSSGAATATRDLLELLVENGHDCRAVTAGILDYHQETKVEEVLISLGMPMRWAQIDLRPGLVKGPTHLANAPKQANVFDLKLNGVRATLLPTKSSNAKKALDQEESIAYLDLVDHAFERFKPHVVLIYGGHQQNLVMMKRARERGIATVFHLHNLSYRDKRAFESASAVLVPTKFAQAHYKQTIGLETVVIEPVIRTPRVIVPEAERKPKYLTLVNPEPAKGLAVWMAVASELGKRRPDIPLLLVESRGTADLVKLFETDLSQHPNLHRMANTPDPRDFYKVSRAVMVPSLVLENAALVAREAMANGIPVLASDRGGLPETLGSAGFVFHVKPEFSPVSANVPKAKDGAPWVAMIEKLWDDPAFEQRHRRLALKEAERWAAEKLVPQYERFFDGLSK